MAGGRTNRLTADRAIALGLSAPMLVVHSTPTERVIRSRAIRHDLLPSPADAHLEGEIL
jgi:hypothetical protein